jgi:hypothetical protein
MGGNIFQGSAPIKKEHIKPTLLNFFTELKSVFPKAAKHFRGMRTLGSVGKKDMSGDIDMAISGEVFKNLQDWDLDPVRIEALFQGFKKRARTASEDQLQKRAVIVAVAEKIQAANTDILVDMKGSGAGALFLLAPQIDEQGENLGVGVQIDINVGDVDWLSFAYYSAKYEGNIKGLHRTQLMLAMFSEKGYTFSHNYGVKDKETQEIVAKTPQQAVEVLNREYNLNLSQADLADYLQLIKILETQIPKETLNSIYNRFIKILDSTRADIPEHLQQYWIDNQQALGLKGKFLPADSKLNSYKIEE